MRKMLLCFDIGNTNITLGAYNSNILEFTARLATDTRKTDDQYAVEIKQLLSLYGIEPADIEDCIISSVVPSVGKSISRAVSKLCQIVPLTLGPGVKTGLNIKIDNPAQLGADLVAGAVGAIDAYKMPCVIIDMGTASTVSVLDRNGAFLGGVIAAGVRLTLKALTENTAQLPAIPIEAPKSVIGTNTTESMQSGLVYGTASMIDGLLEKITAELGETPTVLATGGLSKEVISHCKTNIIYNENLLLEGLRVIYEKNR
jgi:type III pantothenate kinase